MIAVIVGGTYVSSSLLFTKFPHLLPNFVKKRKGWHVQKAWPTNVHISHRGGAGEFYENTLKAFKGANEIGTQMLELDVQLTKDGQVVVSHDQNLLRTTGQNVKIKETDFANLPKLQSKVPIDFAYKAVFSSDRSEEQRLNSSHITISYAVFCLKKKKMTLRQTTNSDKRRHSKKLESSNTII